jgi:GTPase SAR1 family protein
MPLPAVPYIVVGVVAASTAAMTYYNWSKIKKKLFGKTLLLIGSRGCGKTSIAHLLEYDKLPRETEETKTQKSYKAKKVNLSELNIDVNLINDMPGNKEARTSKWRPFFDKSDVVMYVLRSDLFLRGDSDHIARVQQDVRLLKDWVEDQPKKIVFVATFSDKAPEQKKSISDALAENTEFKKIAALIRNTYRSGPAVGSLASTPMGKDLIFHALKEAENI